MSKAQGLGQGRSQITGLIHDCDNRRSMSSTTAVEAVAHTTNHIVIDRLSWGNLVPAVLSIRCGRAVGDVLLSSSSY